MESLSIKLPALFADHHVVEVRRILSELPGIGDIFASSAFRSVEIKYDPALVDDENIARVLAAAGYLDELPLPLEIGAQENGQEKARPFFRHSTAYAQAGKTISFAQDVPITSRSHWPCPGMGVIERLEDEIEEAENA
jgi:copper chaperone CopZ